MPDNSREILRISGMVNDSIVDGPGFRLTVFTQGCPHRCKDCHNPHTHDINGGREISVTEIFDKFMRNSLLSGITLSGGEPLLWAEPLAALAEKVRRAGKTIWLYSGYTFEEIKENRDGNPGWEELLQYTDVLVDGPYIEAQKSLMLKFRGSKNQRIIDAQKSLNAGKIFEIKP